MAKRRKRRSGFGNIIEVRRGMSGLFDSNTVVGDALPVLLGGVSAFAAIAVVRRFIVPRMSAGSSAGTMLNRHAPLLGIGAGVLMGLGLHVTLKRKSPAVVAAAAAALVAGGTYLREGTLMPSAVAGFGAIVPEYGMNAVMPQMNGLGATVLENWPNGRRPDSIGALSAGPDSSYGTTMQLSGGMGNVNTSAFGSPGFAIH